MSIPTQAETRSSTDYGQREEVLDAGGGPVSSALYSGTVSLGMVQGNSSSTDYSLTSGFLARPAGSSVLPTISTTFATQITHSAAQLNGTIQFQGVAQGVRLYFEYGPTTAYGTTVEVLFPDPPGSGVLPVSKTVSNLMANTVYRYRLVAQNDDTTAYGAEQTFATLTMQQGWRQRYFGISTNTGPAADGFDFDQDGLANLLEWACNLDPTRPSVLSVITSHSGATCEFTYNRSVDALNAGAVYVVEWSDELPATNWSSVGVTHGIMSDNGVEQRVRALVPVGNQGRRFIHLSVSAPP